MGISAPLLLGSLLGGGSISLTFSGARDGESKAVLAVQLNGGKGKAISTIDTTIGKSISKDLGVSAPLLLSGLLWLSRAEGGQTPWVLALQLNGGNNWKAKAITAIAKSIELSISTPLLLGLLSWGSSLLLSSAQDWESPDGVLALQLGDGSKGSGQGTSQAVAIGGSKTITTLAKTKTIVGLGRGGGSQGSDSGDKGLHC